MQDSVPQEPELDNPELIAKLSVDKINFHHFKATPMHKKNKQTNKENKTKTNAKHKK